MKISVIIPTFNRAVLLEAALSSIFSQDYPEIEVVVADDGSNDETGRVCTDYEKQAAKLGVGFIVSRSETNHGAQVARNRGFRVATGDCILFLDSDDVLKNGIFHEIGEAFIEPGLDYVWGKVQNVDFNLNPIVGPLIGSSFGKESRNIGGYHWHTLGAAYRRDYLENVGPWNEALTGSQDWEFQARVKLNGGKGRFLNTVFGYWRHYEGQRVGTRKFRPDYVQSVGLACELIREAALRHGRYGDGLGSLLARKLIVHALEFGRNGFILERKKLLDQAVVSSPPTGVAGKIAKILQVAPHNFDRLFHQTFKLLLYLRTVLSLGKAPHSVVSSDTFNFNVKPTRVAIMITTLNRAAELERTLRRLKLLDPPADEIWVTSDGSTDNTANLVRENYPEINLIVHKQPCGSIASRIEMMQKTSCDLVLSLDDDSYPEQSDCLEMLCNFFGANNKLAVAYFPQRSDEYPSTLHQTNFGKARIIRNFANSGACLNVRIYRLLPGFNAMYFHAYEEPDYALQCVANGWEIYYFPEITVRHHYSGLERSEMRTHQRHARNELWSTVIRCPLPYAIPIIIYRVLSQAGYAANRGLAWFIREPGWWFAALVGIPRAVLKRSPVSWIGYKKWLTLPDP